jgi:hypothetical protein
MAITKLSITGNTTSVGISSTPIVISLAHKANATSVTPDGNITTNNVQAALEQLDDIKAQASGGTIGSPTLTGSVNVTGTMTAASINFGDEALSEYDEGNWTPAFNLGITATVNHAKYTRIGNVCIVSFSLSSIDTTSLTGNDTDDLTLSGLPFTAVQTSVGSASALDWTNFAGARQFTLQVDGNTSIIKFDVGETVSVIEKEDINDQVSDGILNGQITYHV